MKRNTYKIVIVGLVISFLVVIVALFFPSTEKTKIILLSVALVLIVVYEWFSVFFTPEWYNPKIRCPKCNFIFEPHWLSQNFSPNSPFTTKFSSAPLYSLNAFLMVRAPWFYKCPHCGKRSWCRAEKEVINIPSPLAKSLFKKTETEIPSLFRYGLIVSFFSIIFIIVIIFFIFKIYSLQNINTPNEINITKEIPDKVSQEEKTSQKFIEVNQPKSNSTISNPVKIEGRASTFEGTVYIRIKDENGKELAFAFTTVQTGDCDILKELCPFSKSTSYSQPSSQKGTIEISGDWPATHVSPPSLVIISISFSEYVQ